MIAAAGASLLVAAIAAAWAVAMPDVPEGRRPPATVVSLQGSFFRSAWQGSVELRTSADGAALTWMLGSVPSTCRDRRGREQRAGRDGDVGVNFASTATTPIQPDGSFSLTYSGQAVAFADLAGSGSAPTTVTITGTFYGNNVLGRVQARTGPVKSGGAVKLSSCRGDQPFWARRVDPR